MADTALTTTIVDRGKFIGGAKFAIAELAFSTDGTYNSTTKVGSDAGLSAAAFGLVTLENLIFLDDTIGGYIPWYDRANARFSLFRSSPAGSVAAPTFTGAEPIGALNVATPVFNGTGFTSSGQAVTTDEVQTMTLNQCAGMWLVATGTGATPPMLILSNTAVTGAVAVFTVQGAAPADENGTWAVYNALAPVGTNDAPAFTGTAGALVEVANGVNISTAISTNKLRVMALGI